MSFLSLFIKEIQTTFSLSTIRSVVNIFMYFLATFLAYLISLYYNFFRREDFVLGKTFGNKLRDLRERRNLTQLEVSKHINCSCKVLSNYELDKREPDFDTLLRICDFFDVTADYLLGRTDVSMHYKEITLDNKAETLLISFEKLPDEYKDDVLRYAKLNLLDLNMK